jgi:hypothetical protein
MLLSWLPSGLYGQQFGYINPQIIEKVGTLQIKKKRF